MSFSYDTKEELCRDAITSKCCALAEAYGILLYCNTFSARGIKIITESRPLVKRLPKLFKKAFGVTFDILPEDDGKTSKLSLEITSREKLIKIFDSCGYDIERTIAQHINLAVLEEDCCRQSFIKGTFLAGGSITDPQKRYHLELVTAHYNVSRETYAMLLDMGFNPKSAPRKGNYITYFKSSTEIEDFLTTIGAPVAAMEIMSTKIEKDMKNSVNRKVNCDTANATKIVEAAQEQVEAIQRLEERGELKNLSEKLRQTAALRMENPELSLAELAAIAEPPVTKSCLNHRLRRLIEISREN